MSNDDSGLEINVPSYKIDDVIQAAARTASATSEPDVTDLGAIPGTEDSTERPDLIPVTEVKLEDVGTLRLRCVDGVPQLVVSGGTAIPASLTVVDGAGNAVGTYATGAAPTTQPRDLMSTYDFPGDDTPIIIGSAR
ncbi:hypothetical protein ABZ705_20310 [Streptomyces sp. NPDC006984]|uniref:hypothetical protein n=1 Tax=Streptomyces sp. NPDC006984 TaxID=3155463 RepID=UPI0033C15204